MEQAFEAVKRWSDEVLHHIKWDKGRFEGVHFKNVFYLKSVFTVEVKNIKLQGYETCNNKEYRAATSED